MVEPLPPQFDADELTGGAVSKDGASAVIEFVNGERDYGSAYLSPPLRA